MNHNKSNLPIILGFGLAVILSLFYTKKKPMVEKYSAIELRTAIKKLLVYFGILIIGLIIIQNANGA